MSFETKTLLLAIAAPATGSGVINRDYPVTVTCSNPLGTSATVLLQGSTDGGTSWHTITTFTLGAADSQVYTTSDKWPMLRGDVTAVVGGTVGLTVVV
jgi:hypothetical protein